MEGCLIYYDEKYGDLMHNCIFTCVEILPLYDEYRCITITNGCINSLTTIRHQILSIFYGPFTLLLANEKKN